jgi:hypothetical protein
MKKFSICLMAAAMLAAPALAQDELQQLTTDGTATVLNNDKAHARDVAIQDALRNAVEQVTGAVVSSSTVVENAMVVEDNIYSKAKGYVKSYSVVSEGEADGGLTYNVKIKAVVRSGAIKEDVADIIRGAGNPRMMVLISERNIGQHEWSGLDVNLGVSENTVIENMRNKGFEFVDQEQAERSARRDKALAAMEGDAAAAALIGNRAGSEVILVGKAFVKEAPGVSDMLGGMKSMQATVTLKAVNTDDGKVLASATKQGKTVHIDEVAGGTKALEMAANDAADYLSNEIVKRFTRGSNSVTLSVTGVSNYATFTDFVNVLKYEIRGVKAVHEREAAGNVGLVEVDTRFKSSQLAQELQYKPFPKVTVIIRSVTANKISLRLVPKASR